MCVRVCVRVCVHACGVCCASVWSLYIALFPVEVVMSGSGLNNTKDPAAAVCRFTRTDQPMDELTTKATPVGYHRLTCPLPAFNDTSKFEG